MSPDQHCQEKSVPQSQEKRKHCVLRNNCHPLVSWFALKRSHGVAKVQSFYISEHRWSLLFLGENIFASLFDLSDSTVSGEGHDSHERWIKSEGTGLFSLLKEIFSIYSCRRKHRRSCSQPLSTSKKDQWTDSITFSVCNNCPNMSLYFFTSVLFLFLYETWRLSLFLRTEDWKNGAQKTAFICVTCFLERTHRVLCSLSHAALLFIV